MSSGTAPPAREQEASLEMAATRVARPAAALATVLFLALLALAMVAEWWFPPAPTRRDRRPIAWQEISAAAREDGLLSADELLAEKLATSERSIAEEGALSRRLRPTVQEWLLDHGGYGNQQVRRGSNDWLYFEPEIAAVIGPGFLPPARGGSKDVRRERDPVAAIVALARSLERRHIALVVVPIPGKTTFAPEGLVGNGTHRIAYPRNRSFGEFRTLLARHGVDLFDVVPALAARARQGGVLFLRGDSHWRPEAAEAASEALAEHLASAYGLAPAPGMAPTRGVAYGRGRPDLVRLLSLPAERAAPWEEIVETHPVSGLDPAPLLARGWQAQVLLLGDSYSEIYENGFCGYGHDAGLPHQLGYALRQPVDHLLVPAESGSDPRRELARQLASDATRVDGIRVVVYEFAERELVLGDWPVVDLPPPA